MITNFKQEKFSSMEEFLNFLDKKSKKSNPAIYHTTNVFIYKKKKDKNVNKDRYIVVDQDKEKSTNKSFFDIDKAINYFSEIGNKSLYN